MSIPPGSGPPEGLRGNPWQGPTGDRPPWEHPSPPPETPAETTQRIPPTPPPVGSPPTDLVARVAHGDSAWTRLVRTLGRLFSSAKEPRELQEVIAALQAPVSTGRRIAVTSVRGGAGKTALTALLGSVFAARRPDPILAVDADPDAGSLAWRLGADSSLTLAGLPPGLHTASGGDLGGVANLLPRTSAGLWVAPGGSGNPTLARDITRALSRLFGVAVLDCGTGMNAPATSAVLSDAHAVVVAVPATPDGVRTTAAILDGVAASSGDLSRVVIALNATDPSGLSALKRSAAESAFARYHVPVVAVPHDRHVASGAVISPSKIGEPTLVAASCLAAWSLGRAQQL